MPRAARAGWGQASPSLRGSSAFCPAKLVPDNSRQDNRAQKNQTPDAAATEAHRACRPRKSWIAHSPSLVTLDGTAVTHSLTRLPHPASMQKHAPGSLPRGPGPGTSQAGRVLADGAPGSTAPEKKDRQGVTAGRVKPGPVASGVTGRLRCPLTMAGAPFTLT